MTYTHKDTNNRRYRAVAIQSGRNLFKMNYIAERYSPDYEVVLMRANRDRVVGADWEVDFIPKEGDGKGFSLSGRWGESIAFPIAPNPDMRPVMLSPSWERVFEMPFNFRRSDGLLCRVISVDNIEDFALVEHLIAAYGWPGEEVELVDTGDGFRVDLWSPYDETQWPAVSAYGSKFVLKYDGYFYIESDEFFRQKNDEFLWNYNEIPDESGVLRRPPVSKNDDWLEAEVYPPDENPNNYPPYHQCLCGLMPRCRCTLKPPPTAPDDYFCGEYVNELGVVHEVIDIRTREDLRGLNAYAQACQWPYEFDYEDHGDGTFAVKVLAYQYGSETAWEDYSYEEAVLIREAGSGHVWFSTTEWVGDFLFPHDGYNFEPEPEALNIQHILEDEALVMGHLHTLPEGVLGGTKIQATDYMQASTFMQNPQYVKLIPSFPILHNFGDERVMLEFDEFLSKGDRYQTIFERFAGGDPFAEPKFIGVKLLTHHTQGTIACPGDTIIRVAPHRYEIVAGIYNGKDAD